MCVLITHVVDAWLNSFSVALISSLLLTPVFSIPKAIEEIYFNSSAATDLSRLSDLIAVLLGVLETGPGVVMPIDVLHLTQMIERAASTQIYTANASREAVVSLATDYLRLASEMITPDMAAQWMDSPEGEVSQSSIKSSQKHEKHLRSHIKLCLICNYTVISHGYAYIYLCTVLMCVIAI